MKNKIKLNEKMHEGNEALLRQNYTDAIQLFQQARALAPGNSAARSAHYRAQVHAALDQSGLSFYQKIRKTWLLLCFHLTSTKNKSNRYKLSEKIWLLTPLNDRGTHILIETAQSANKTKFAVLALHARVSVQPNQTKWLSPLAQLAKESHQTDIQIEALEHLLTFKVDDIALQKELEQAKQQQDQNQAKSHPLHHIKKQLENDPDNVSLRMEYLDGQLRSRKFDEAISELEAYLKSQSSPSPRLEKRLFLAREHQINFKLAVAQDQHNIALIDLLRSEHDQLRIEQIKLQVERSPNDLQLRFDFGKVLYDCREWDQALAQFQHAIHHRQRRIRSLIYRANILEKLERHAEAKKELEIALNELPDMTREKREISKQLERLSL
ncbi:MAG: hypothetical protein ACJZ86_04000 [Pontiellaceae bacterium]